MSTDAWQVRGDYDAYDKGQPGRGPACHAQRRSSHGYRIRPHWHHVNRNIRYLLHTITG